MRGWIWRTRLLGVALGVAITVAGSGCGDDEKSAGSSDEYVIGVVAGLTGYLAPYDTPTLNSMKMAARDINAKGGLDGKYKVVIKVRNSEGDIGKTAAMTKELINEGADFIASPCDIDPAISAGRVAGQEGIPNISLCSAGTQVPKGGGEWTFGHFPSEIHEGTAVADYAYEELGARTGFILICDGNIWTRTLPVVFKNRFEELGGKVIGDARFEFGQTDFGSVVSKIRQADPEVVQTNMYEPEFPAFVKQLRAAGVDAQILENNSVDTETVLGLGSPVEGMVYTTPAYIKPGSQLEKFHERYQKEFGEEAISYAFLGYDIVASILDPAVKAAGSTESAKVRDAINELENIPTASGGTITFKGQNRVGKRDLFIVKVEDGKRVLIDEQKGIDNPQ
jgi:branched-chain amino acid transport system substrate-binding protein